MTPRRWRALGEVYVAPPPGPSQRSFGLTVGTVFGLMAAVLGWRGHLLRSEMLGGIGAVLVLAALVAPASLSGLAKGWSRVGHALGWVNSRVLLTLMFVLILWPAGVLNRWFGVDLLDAKRRSGSFWFPYSSRLRDAKHFERLY